MKMRQENNQAAEERRKEKKADDSDDDIDDNESIESVSDDEFDKYLGMSRAIPLSPPGELIIRPRVSLLIRPVYGRCGQRRNRS